MIYYLFIYTQNRAALVAVFLAGSAAHQLYFIPSLMVLYLIFPLLHRAYRLLAHPLVLLLVGGLEMRLLYQDYFIQNLSTPFPVSIGLLAFFAFIVGMVASHHHEHLIKLTKKWLWPVSLVTLFLAGYIFNQGRTRYFMTWNIKAFYSQWRPSVLLYTLSLSAVLNYWFTKTNWNRPLVSMLSGLSFFVFWGGLLSPQNSLLSQIDRLGFQAPFSAMIAIYG